MKTAHIDDLSLLLRILPPELRSAIDQLPPQDLLEIVLDLGRPPQARLITGHVDLREQAVAREDLARLAERIGTFAEDNRAGIEGTLHRISALRNRRGEVVGLTLRIGRAVFGTIGPIRDLVEAGKNLLLLGRPGVGKTTMLREVARVLADELDKRVMIVDTSNEIAGDGDIPHPGIGSARRMQVPRPDRQHAVMIEAVENHMPEVIVIDEISSQAEALAARTIAERGVQLIGTAHGTILENLVQNPALADLVGGIETVILGDEEARLRGTQKTIRERRGPPTFDAVIEIIARDQLSIHRDAARAVDQLLQGRLPRGQMRRIAPAVTEAADPIMADEDHRPESPPNTPVEGPAKVYAYALSRDSVDRVIRDLNLPARTVKYPDQANLIIGLQSRGDDARLYRLAEQTGAKIQLVKRNSTAQIRRVLEQVFHVVHGYDAQTVDAAVREAELAAARVRSQGASISLAPQPAPLRRLQHRIATQHQLLAHSEGREPERHLVFAHDETKAELSGEVME